MNLTKITKLALLMNKIHEFYYVFNNSYAIKIKTPGLKNPGVNIVSHPLPAWLFGVHGYQEFFIGFGLAQPADKELHGLDGGHVREVISEYPELVEHFLFKQQVFAACT